MENTLLVALSRQMVLERQMDVVANNVANANTNGFKADKSLFEEFLRSGAHEDNFVGNDRRVSFVNDRATIRDFASGPNLQTGNPLDVAVNGNGFLVVQTPAGERYTRDGALQINAQGQLVTNGGNLVLGTNGPITFQATDRDINVSADGTITVREGTVTQVDSIRGKLRLVTFNNPQQLVKEGANLFTAPAGVAAQPDTLSRVNQGFVEKSNVNVVTEMTRLMEITRTYQSVASLMQQQNDLRKSAIQMLADVPA
ncbi:MAG: flagellar basal-body rod protein FlgF [Afipia sp.]|nr:flagellar basal-body rod protein FlgF [Afipia sp.]OJW62866.1 MAG: flagellar basal-body rod protein FlgF [Afipia sp. 64-13]